MVVMIYIRFWTPIAWTWYVLIGSLITFLVAWLAGLCLPACFERTTRRAFAERRDL